ncbi:hypothetical protein [Arenibaculum sp.]|jgi:hypothetical protein|uniref:hypothetical protein n=1 Tax=Arenibaculum sp. TaxID=2865862 RepID=UPI002E0FA566|nr:hypothetical protein [Arenibaculum sp.]
MAPMPRFPSARKALRRLVPAVLALGVALLPPSGAAAAPACYTKTEFEAELALRLHTELMVVGLTCHKIDLAQDFFGKYQQFTKRHRAVLIDFEARLVDHFRRVERATGERRFHSFRTALANEVAQRAALLTPATYCQFGRTLVDRMMSLSTAEFVSAVGTEDQGGRLVNSPLCDDIRTASR